MFPTGKEDGEPPDAFAQVEKKTSDKLAALETKDRLEELMEFSEARNSDPFGLSPPQQIVSGVAVFHTFLWTYAC